MKKIYIAGLCLIVGLSPTFGEVVDNAFLARLAEEARTNSPALRATASRVEAAQNERAAVRTWQDPMFEFGGVLARKEMRMEEGDVVYGIEQPLPLFGKPRAAKELADAEIVAAEAKHEMDFQLLRRDLSIAAFTLAQAHEEIALAREEFRWFELTQRVAEERYANGAGAQIETLRAQTETARARTMIRSSEEELAVAESELNRLLNRKGTPSWESLELPELSGPVPFNDSVVRLALSGEPELKALREEARAAEARVGVARKMAKPDMAVAVEGRQYSASGAFKEGALVVKMNLPWFNRDKYRADIQKQKSLSDAAAAEAESYETGVRAEIRMLVAKIENARREALLQRDEVIPRAQQTLTAAEAGWRTGGDSFREVLDIRRMLFDARKAYIRAVGDQYRALTELVLCCGLGDLEALEMLQEVEARKEKP